MSIIVRLIFLVLCMCGLSLAFTNVQLGARRQLQLKMSAKNPSPQNLKHRMVEKLIGNAMQVGSIASIAAAGAALSNAAVAHAADDEPLFIETESGLKYRDTKTGEGESPVPGDTVRVHYTGWLDGFNSEKKFDSSYDRRSPLVFKAGVKQVIAGTCIRAPFDDFFLFPHTSSLRNLDHFCIYDGLLGSLGSYRMISALYFLLQVSGPEDSTIPP
mmetsp:Transcript_25070/g.41950  ORF Transcript_25070/g.41950 Transcript_25070/m.41950 type:complete len:215 (-) Transcript_25070:356-1000(-)